MKTDRLREIIESPEWGDIATEKALVILYNLQDLDEQESKSTKKQNNRGFNGTDAGFGSSLAQRIISSSWPEGKRLTINQLTPAKKMILKYHSQLDERDLLPDGCYLELPGELAYDLEILTDLAIKDKPMVASDWWDYLENDPTAGDKIVVHLLDILRSKLKRT